ncbi:hypothetical protein YH64_009025 [Achromobacter sp. LC458]|jgi:hypothetical protein|uniref:hypothetical protein n=1 Tax=Achromobacter marplatensis TaxID=470868 RepID=UPI00062A03DA|nr:hypothetical protein [Achromobacter marplatensis]TRM53232.1 hypothetical protein YH64_009025 [Achromobacter sp. LC458]
MDWKNLISDLQAIGWTQVRIAKAMGDKPQSWVADICKGRYRDLKWSDGERLIKLHRRETRRSVTKRAEEARAA